MAKGDFILFLAREANFQSRTMLIPKDLLTPKRLRQFDELRSCSEKLSDNTYCHHMKLIWDGNRGYQLPQPINQFVNYFTSYACGMEEECYFDMDDKEWYDNSFCNLCYGFDHVSNFNELMKLTSCRG